MKAINEVEISNNNTDLNNKYPKLNEYCIKNYKKEYSVILNESYETYEEVERLTYKEDDVFCDLLDELIEVNMRWTELKETINIPKDIIKSIDTYFTNEEYTELFAVMGIYQDSDGQLRYTDFNFYFFDAFCGVSTFYEDHQIDQYHNMIETLKEFGSEPDCLMEYLECIPTLLDGLKPLKTLKKITPCNNRVHTPYEDVYYNPRLTNYEIRRKIRIIERHAKKVIDLYYKLEKVINDLWKEVFYLIEILDEKNILPEELYMIPVY